MTSLRHRLSRDEGFTLIELLVVIVIIGILLAIAVPSYLGFRDRANKRAAQSDLRAAVPSAEAFYADNEHYNTAGVPPFTIAALQAIDSGLADNLTIASGTDTDYCLTSTHGDQTWSLEGPGPQWYESDDCSGSAVSP